MPCRLTLLHAFATLALIAGMALAPPVAAQEDQETQARGSFDDETSVTYVEVPVTVVRDGEPVRGLTRENFQIFEGRKRREIVDFEVVDLATVTSTQAARSELPASARRTFLMLFDLSFADPGLIGRARGVAREMVLDDLHPTDLVAVATYTLSRGPELVLGFTSDRQQIALAIESLGVSKLAGRELAPDPLSMILSPEGLAGGGSGPETGGGQGVGGDAEYLAILQEIAEQIERGDRRQQVNQVIAMSRSMSDLAKLLDSVSGRKQVVYFSQGFDSSLLLGSASGAVQNQQAVAAMVGDYSAVDSEARFGNTRLQSNIDDMLEEFRRADATIQAVDVSGLRADGGGGSRMGTEQALYYMANETGGELYENFNDLGQAMGQMLDRTSVTYLLTFRPEDLEDDGSYHRLRVELEGVPRGTRAVHRPGYYAPTPFEGQTPLQKRLRTADRILSGEPGGEVTTRVLAPPFAGSATDATAYVPVLVEIDGASLLRGSTSGVVPLEIYAYAMDANGGVIDLFTQAVQLDMAKVGDAVRASGLKYFGHVSLPPGEYDLRLFVRNGATGRSALEVVSVEVPRHGGSDPVVLPVLFPEAPGTWVLLRETEDRQRRDVVFPFMLKEQPYIPAVLPELPPGQATTVNLIAYNLKPGVDPEIEARVVQPDGTAMTGATLAIGDRFRLEGETADRIIGSFEVTDLPPGDYRLEVTVTDPESRLSGESVTAFRVVRPPAGS